MCLHVRVSKQQTESELYERLVFMELRGLDETSRIRGSMMLSTRVS